MTQDKFEFESLQEPEAVCGYLRSVIEGLENGSITLATNGDTIALAPGGLIKVAVKARKKPLSSKLVIKLSWKDEDADQDDVMGSMTIAAG